ncbi:MULTISPECIES: formate--tetrahydrofolate ligase [unclassified Pseudovibrio]|uniref:formate--tetrahydrofolate ligase n=1 Tax=unclassified Pseudovibrio TaxID=2627060 RepID=UPI00070E8DD2|nr:MULTISPECIES: formate--tetrahydrofolate ligase [unclassified Pseudovibrio]KZL02524.1 Formate--tetrahydrofolate ligase [Pseudovibrio sp. W74]KZL07933.1 Formate--tetrahydrofolate ligase [Pseudovibrio sp. Ad14]
MKDIEIARAADMKPIARIAQNLKIPEDALEPYGRFKAKVNLDEMPELNSNPYGKLILVTAVSPTPAGEGKTTTTVGLGDALNRIGLKTTICLREPSLGPCFGMKGGAAGGGYAQVVPMEDINLHFTGDLHAITAAHNLLSAMIDNHIYWGNAENIDQRRIVWRRVVDINDRSLRSITTGLGGVSNGFPSESGYDITVASEVMAVLCLAESLQDLQERLGRLLIGYRKDKTPIYCRDLKADGAMTALLKDAFRPNLVQTLENNPAFIHGGPFANIAHGCNSVIATKTALRLSDYVVTEAGFGADLGAEKFFNIKCRQAGLTPNAVVVVATVRALKMHGGVAKNDLTVENIPALEKGMSNLERHVKNCKRYGVPVIVAINRYGPDTDQEIDVIMSRMEKLGVKAVPCTHWANGSAGTEELATSVSEILQTTQSEFKHLYEDDLALWKKIRRICKKIYGASKVTCEQAVKDQLKSYEEQGYGHLSVCMAKTPYSFSTDPALLGAPSDYSIHVRAVRLSAGAGFIVALTGDIMVMPGLPRHPAAETIGLDENSQIEGLF